MRISREPLKFRNKPTEVEGLRFDSKREAARYAELQLLEKAGDIRHILFHPTFVLQDAFDSVIAGTRVRAVRYEADFQYQERSMDGWIDVVEDVKGFETEGFKIKKKLFWKRYPNLTLRIVR